MHRAQDSTEARSSPLFLTSFTDQRTPAADQLINFYQLVLSDPMAPACVTLWRQLQTRFWDASPRASVQKQQAMVFSFFTVFSLTIVDFSSMTPWMNKLSSVHIT